MKLRKIRVSGRRPMAKWKDYRTAVRESLHRKSKSTYWLSNQLGDAVTRQHLYAYLRGETGISLEVQAKINDILGLRFTDEPGP
jgi:hypothetical protein